MFTLRALELSFWPDPPSAPHRRMFFFLGFHLSPGSFPNNGNILQRALPPLPPLVWPCRALKSLLQATSNTSLFHALGFSVVFPLRSPSHRLSPLSPFPFPNQVAAPRYIQSSPPLPFGPMPVVAG